MDEIQRELPLPFPELSGDLPLLPARMVNEYQYCPRLAYLEWVQGEWRRLPIRSCWPQFSAATRRGLIEAQSVGSATLQLAIDRGQAPSHIVSCDSPRPH